MRNCLGTSAGETATFKKRFAGEDPAAMGRQPAWPAPQVVQSVSPRLIMIWHAVLLPCPYA